MKNLDALSKALPLQLVKDASNWKKWWSMRLIILTALFQSIVIAYATLPSDWLPGIPEGVKTALAFGALITAAAAGVARVVQQPALEKSNGNS